MHKSKPVKTPLGQHFRLSCSQSPKNDDELHKMEYVPYFSEVGSRKPYVLHGL